MTIAILIDVVIMILEIEFISFRQMKVYDDYDDCLNDVLSFEIKS